MNSLIVRPHPEIKNFLFANGFSGHGLQQSPAVGQLISEQVRARSSLHNCRVREIILVAVFADTEWIDDVHRCI